MSDLQEWRDWRAICEGKARYCRLLDTKDWAGFRALFTEDCVLEVEGAPEPAMTGRDHAIGSVEAAIGAAKTAHQVHSPEIRIDGDEARVVWAMQDRVDWGPERGSLTGFGHYHERWVRRDGTWKIAALKLTRLHVEMHPPAG